MEAKVFIYTKLGAVFCFVFKNCFELLDNVYDTVMVDLFCGRFDFTFEVSLSRGCFDPLPVVWRGNNMLLPQIDLYINLSEIETPHTAISF